ncbi:MbnP family protein [Ferruginibacter sp. HRS2-29]|uniref:MbnP family protein n=1 Tax=Ferruginibacter sp. HRS2-29 TaxID=2487334 RepID=UPI0020CD521D|nr:MbnP family protein [Ferruginibacter sp. HRS2-29]MCP9749976.1 hypothetical protein [Ferruginibacter sp. HRS2-29]
MKHIFFLTISAALLFTSCKKDEVIVTPETEGQTTITFDAKVGENDFALDQNFTIGANTFKFSNFRYWISGVSLIDSKGTEYKVANSYYLVEETKAVDVQEGTFTYPAKKREDVVIKGIPVGDYKSIRFSVGVDETHNNNLSLQAGELSQLSGMTNSSWMWLTSYIFTSIQGTVINGGVTKNVKAETGLNTNYKTVTLELPSAIHISSAKATGVNVKVDIAKVVDGIDLFANPTVGASQSTLMATLATNYGTKAFSVMGIK